MTEAGVSKRTSGDSQKPRNLVEVRVPPGYDVCWRPEPRHQVPEGSVVVVRLSELSRILHRLGPAFVELRTRYPSCSIVLAVPPSLDPSARHLLSGIPMWQAVPVVEQGSDGMSERGFRQAIFHLPGLEERVLGWLLTMRPRGRRVEGLLRRLLARECTTPLSEALGGNGYSRRSVFRSLRAAGLPPPTEIHQLIRAARFALALQDPESPSVEKVAMNFGYGGGSVVSRLFSRRFRTNTAEVRERLGWAWLAARWLSGM